MEIKNNDRGGILVLLAVSITVFFMLIVFAIDSTLMVASKGDSDNYARLAALAAIEAHFASTEANLTDIIDDAKDAAVKVVSGNRAVSDTTNTGGIVRWDALAPGTNALLTPGNWYYSYPQGYNSDGSAGLTQFTLCDGTAATQPPCFGPLPNPITGSEAVNAYQVSGTLYNSLPTKLSGGFFPGTESFSPVVHTIASTIPRHGCFIIDISPSMAFDTHPFRTGTPQLEIPELGRFGAYALDLSVDNGAGNGFLHHDDWFNKLPGNRPVLYVGDGTGFMENPTLSLGEFCADPNTNDTTAPACDDNPVAEPTPVEEIATTDTFSRVHFISDYVVRAPLHDSDYTDTAFSSNAFSHYHPDPTADASLSVNSLSKLYRVDAYTVPANTPAGANNPAYNGPEPLTTVFAGLKKAVEMFEDRAVAGDEACIIFYDDQFIWPRIFNLTDDWAYLKSVLDFTNRDGNEFANDAAGLIGAVGDGTYASDSGFRKTIRHFLFPFPEGYTNTTGALNLALGMLSAGANASVPSADFVVMIGDGLANCDTDLTPTCGQTQAYYSSAMSDIQDLVNNNMVPNRIPLHVIAVGRAIAPHTLNLADPDDTTKCISDKKARAQTLSFSRGYDATHPTDTAAFTNDIATASPTAPYISANADLYSLAAASRGIWGPIRPSPSGCTVQANADCSGHTDPTAETTTRRLNDPLCRSTNDQIEAYMGEIMGDTPFTIVD